MFRSFARANIRRLIHTSSSRPVSSRASRIGVLLGASAATGYLAWNSQHISLDSATTLPKHATPLTPKSSMSKDVTDSDSGTRQREPTLRGHEDENTSPFTTEEPTSSTSSQNTEAASEETAEAQEGGGGGAFNPVTGEINWDCPCLGGMAHGPCGLQFREAFSCFVYSEQEPKGIDCVEKFKAMQQCFREHPDVYGDDIMDDDDDDEASPDSSEDIPASQSSGSSSEDFSVPPTSREPSTTPEVSP